MNRHLLLLTAVIGGISLTGCSTVGQSTLLGAGTVGALGLGIGAAAQHSVGSALIGLGVGAAFGAGMGYLTHKENERRAIQMKLGSTPETADKNEPSISTPQIRKIWVPEKILDGSRYEAGHWLWVIEKPALWRKP